MTNAQLYLAIGVPIVVNIVFFLQLDRRIDRLEERIDRLEDSLRTEIAALRDMLTGKVIEHEGRIAKLEPK